MAQQPVTAEKKARTAEQPLVPPEERFWQRYSPHHEFPLSGAASVTVHALILGALAFLAFRLFSDDETRRPVKIDMVEIDGADGNFDGLGFGQSFFKEDKRRRTEFGSEGGNPTSAGKQDGEKRDDITVARNFKQADLKVEPGGEEPNTSGTEGGFDELDKTIKGIEHSIAMAMNPSAKTAGGPRSGKDDKDVKGSPGGPLGSKGSGLRGKGGGAGNSPYGTIFSKQQKRQMRWKILASADGNEHLAKLKALKVTLVVPTPQQGVFKLMDLSRPNPSFEIATNLVNQGDKVWWTNKDQQQVGALAAVLGIRPPPHAFVIFLPKPLEERMLDLERQHAGQGVSEDQIELTTWNVPFRDGRWAREPEIVAQRLRKSQ
jgi:hypothetical protein